MGRDNLKRHRRLITMSYVFMFLALFTGISAAIAYFLAHQVARAEDAEVWIHAQSLWIIRNVILFMLMAVFAALWFIPACFIYWDSMLWVKTCTVIGVIFSIIAWLFLLNAWLKGLIKYLQKKAAF